VSRRCTCARGVGLSHAGEARQADSGRQDAGASRVSASPSASTSAFTSVNGAIGSPTAAVTTRSASFDKMLPSWFTSPNAPPMYRSSQTSPSPPMGAKLTAAVITGETNRHQGGPGAGTHLEGDLGNGEESRGPGWIRAREREEPFPRPLQFTVGAPKGARRGADVPDDV